MKNAGPKKAGACHQPEGFFGMIRKVCAATAVALSLTVAPALAEGYPDKPIDLTVNFGAGGATDTVARLVGEKMSELLGQKIVVFNKAGAGGTIGVAAVATQAPDGYHIGTANMPSLAILPLMRELPYKPDDVVQIAAVMPYDYAIFARADAPYSTWDELVAYSKANPGKVSFGSVGAGTTNHLMMERLEKAAGVTWRHVPFKSESESVAALAGSHVDLINSSVPSAYGAFKGGKAKAILITSEGKLSNLDGVPTVADKGFDFAQVSFMSIIAPKGIEAAERAKLEAAIKQAVEDPGVKAAAAKLDANLKFVSGKDYDKMLAKMRDEWGALLKELNIAKK